MSERGSRAFHGRVSDASNRLMGATIRRDLMFNVVQVGITALILVFLLFGNAWFGISVATLVLIVNYARGVMGSFGILIQFSRI